MIKSSSLANWQSDTAQGKTFEQHDSTDLTPSQLAGFYKACDGDYDVLFHNTPPADIAYIYKNLGCVHSLQPRRTSSTDAQTYSDPVIPALKVDGWIVWSTIQLLLAPDEHAEFLRKALVKWDVGVPGGTIDETFPKILPRSCFPQAPDPIMQAWYDGMTERLRKEMEDDEGIRVKPIRDDDVRSDSPVHKHHHMYHHQQDRIRHVPHSSDTDDDYDDFDEPHKNDALAYFRNPLFRTVDGLKKATSKRPAMDPRNSSFVQRGKFAAATVGRVVQNVASPHLWNGGHKPHVSISSHDDHDNATEDKHRGRRSLPDKHRYQDDYVGRSSSQASPTLPHSRVPDRMSSRRGSYQPDSNSYWSSGAAATGDDTGRHTQPSHRQRVSPDLHHRRSDDLPEGELPRDYFPPPPVSGHSHVPPTSENTTPPYRGTHRRSPSAQMDPPRPHSPAAAGAGAGFGPSVSPLFATHVARGEPPAAYTHPYAYPYRGPESRSRPPLQRRTDFRSPERGAAGSRPGSRQREQRDSADGSRPGSVRDYWEGFAGGDAGGGGGMKRSESSGNFGAYGPRVGKKGPRSVGGGGGGGNKYGMGVGGVDGRKYPVQGGDVGGRGGR